MRPLVAVLCVLALVTAVSAECPWVLWVETPATSDQWAIAAVPQSRFTAKESCERLAADLNTFELSMSSAHRARGEAHDTYSCLPCTVDPRPEGALPHEGVGPSGPRAK